MPEPRTGTRNLASVTEDDELTSFLGFWHGSLLLEEEEEYSSLEHPLRVWQAYLVRQVSTYYHYYYYYYHH